MSWIFAMPRSSIHASQAAIHLPTKATALAARRHGEIVNPPPVAVGTDHSRSDELVVQEARQNSRGRRREGPFGIGFWIVPRLEQVGHPPQCNSGFDLGRTEATYLQYRRHQG
ncbi:hypothetical protein HHL08_08680 [Sphingobium sp. AR-3-1]|uniref:Uncharacterized protein n=1 Tax=Sphingobium psychrophilum TaxID=2728834 RepID=A0A7X9ZT41_9SPHN|nr:hypothetical protein [Sphingobium psychrophilum]NML10226.1 hypothetical protein [Sphingobium psychrophilum]